VRSRSQVAQVADAVPLMYAGFLAFFLGLATFFVRAPPRRLRCAALDAHARTFHFASSRPPTPLC
jgi:hypothetical protein